MKRVDWRIIVGSLLILAGLISLLQVMGVIPPWLDLFAGIVGIGGGIAFLYVFFTNRQLWWALIAGCVLLGIGVASFLPDPWDGAAFLGGVSVAFWAVYLTDRRRWWAIIPAGVILTLAAITALSGVLGGVDTGGIFFLGLGLTFLLVALLAGLAWAYFPAAALIVMAVVLGIGFGGTLDYLWIGALFLAGLVLILLALRRR